MQGVHTGRGSFWKGRRFLIPDRCTLAAQAKDDELSVVDQDANDDVDDIEDENEYRERNLESAPESDNEIIHLSEDDFFSPVDCGWRNLFVTCNGTAVRIYEANHRQKLRGLQRYEDDDVTEQFYWVGWTNNADSHQEWWVFASGGKGMVCVITPHNGA